MARDGNAKNGSGPAATRVRPEGRAPLAISRILAEDIGRVWEIERESYTHPWPRDAFDKIVRDQTFGTIAARNPSGELVGYIIYSEVVDELHVLNVAVHKDWRRKGVASFLLGYLHRTAFRRGRLYSFLEVRESNASAQDLYNRFGYKPLTKRREYYEDTREDAIVMGAELKEETKS